jgi:hypothetical protein
VFSNRRKTYTPPCPHSDHSLEHGHGLYQLVFTDGPPPRLVESRLVYARSERDAKGFLISKIPQAIILHVYHCMPEEVLP